MDCRVASKLPSLRISLSSSAANAKYPMAKVSTARTLWIPAVNNEGSFGRWAFVEIDDPWDAKKTIRSFLECGD